MTTILLLLLLLFIVRLRQHVAHRSYTQTQNQPEIDRRKKTHTDRNILLISDFPEF